MPPSGSVEPVPSRATMSGDGPDGGVATIAAVGAWFVVVNVIRWIPPPSKST